jgi:hypothetical protein
MADDVQVKFRVSPEIHERLQNAAEDHGEGSVAKLAYWRTLRTLGITPDGPRTEVAASVTEEEFLVLVKAAKDSGTNVHGIVQELVRNFIELNSGTQSSSEPPRQGLRLADDRQGEEALDRGLHA